MTKNFSLLVAAAVLTVAWATSCTDVCFGTCEMSASGANTFLPFFRPFVRPNLDGCRAVCSATCTCVDSCSTACGAQLAACREGASGFFYFLWCQMELTTCSAACGTNCGMTITASIMSRAINTLLPPPEV